LSSAATSIAVIGCSAEGVSATLPYQATAALRSGLCAAYSHTIRPPQQKPVMASLPASPPLLAAQLAAASRSAITCESGTFATTGRISSMLAILDTSPWRA